MVSSQLDQPQKQGEGTGRQAAHSQHQRQPTGVRMWPLVPYAAKDGEGKQRGDGSGAKNSNAGAEELAGVWLHKVGTVACCISE